MIEEEGNGEGAVPLVTGHPHGDADTNSKAPVPKATAHGGNDQVFSRLVS